MPTTRLSRSIPFWVLAAGSVVAVAGGAYLLITKLAVMAATLTDGSATGVEVYAGQTWAVIGGILFGAGLVGLALTLSLAVLRSAPAPQTAEVIDIVEVPVAVETPVQAPPTSRADLRAAAASETDALSGEDVVDDAAEAPRA